MKAVRGPAAILAAAIVAAFAADAANAAQRPRLVSFGSCAALEGYAKQEATKYAGSFSSGIGLASPGSAPRVLVPGVSAAAAANADSPAAPIEGIDYSGTNDQEVGVDEPDIVKTNGNTLFALEAGTLESVDVSGQTPRLLDSLPLSTGWSGQLLLSGTDLLVLSHGGYWLRPLPAQPASMVVPVPSSSVLTEIDVSDPSSLHVVDTLTLDGEYVDARMIGSTVRVVTSTSLPVELPLVTAGSTAAPGVAAANADNRKVIGSSRLSAWMPTYRRGRGPARPVVQCRDVRRPAQFSGLGMLTVLTIDLSKGLAPLASTAVMTDGRIVYASPTSLYVATERWSYRPALDAPTIAPSGSISTQISSFDISEPDRTTYTGSVTVRGYLLDQWSMSDFQGVLRVVSTSTPAWWGEGPVEAGQSYLTTFTHGAGAALSQAGQVSGLGRGERVYAVRMVGNVAFVETFRQVDPLYTIDVSDPADPRVVGQLELPSYNAYLQPIGSDLLLGIGQDVDAQGEPQGTQLTLFDISDLAHPGELAHLSLGQGWSQAESNSHAFLTWPATNLVVVPFNDLAVGLKVGRSLGIHQLGTIEQGGAAPGSVPIDRSLVVRSSILTVSSTGLEASSIATLAPETWLPFPTTVEPPSPLPTPGPLPAPAPVAPAVGGAGAAVG
jgi:uncharacterized secreted protein with C-terminal beta-propeller domain